MSPGTVLLQCSAITQLHHAKQSRIPVHLESFCAMSYCSPGQYTFHGAHSTCMIILPCYTNLIKTLQTCGQGFVRSKLYFFHVLSFSFSKVCSPTPTLWPWEGQSLKKPLHALFVLVILTQGLYLRILFVQLWTRFSTHWEGWVRGEGFLSAFSI